MVGKVRAHLPLHPQFYIQEVADSPRFCLRPRNLVSCQRKTFCISSYHIDRAQPYSYEVMLESTAEVEALAQKDKDRQMLESAKDIVES